MSSATSWRIRLGIGGVPGAVLTRRSGRTCVRFLRTLQSSRFPILGKPTFSSRSHFFRLLVVYESWSGEKWKKKVGHFVPTFPGLRPRTTVTATRRVFRQGFPLASFRRVGGSDGAFATRFFIRVSKPSISNSPAYSKLLFANWYSPYHFFGMDEM